MQPGGVSVEWLNMKCLSPMLLWSVAVLATAVIPVASQTPPEQTPSFELISIKPTPANWRGGRFTAMNGAHQFVARNYTVQFMLMTAYNLLPREITGGPTWIDSDAYDIVGTTQGGVRPKRSDEIVILRNLLADKFHLTFHAEQKESSIYVLSVETNGIKLKESAARADDLPTLINQMVPGNYVRLPARNASMAQFATMLQRVVLDGPVMDNTGLTGRYDFDLEWTPDETQFEGRMRSMRMRSILEEKSGKPDLFEAMQQQLGLKLESAKGPVEVAVIDHVERPSEN